MSDTRQALEEAFKVMFGTPPTLSYEDWQDGNFTPEHRRFNRFRRFLDAEAWTDAALMLVPEGKCWHIRYDPRLTGATVMDQDGFNQHHTLAETPALALLEACLEARENADG